MKKYKWPPLRGSRLKMCQLESEGAGAEWSWERRAEGPSVSAPELSKPASVSQSASRVISDHSAACPVRDLHPMLDVG